MRACLGAVERGVGDSSGLPILKNVLIQTDGSQIKLTTTNLEIAISVIVPGKALASGSVTVPTGVLRELVSNIPSERISLSSKNNKLEIKTDNYQAVIQGLPAEDFPIIPTIKNKKDSIKIKNNALKEALGQVVTSAQFSDLRPELNSVFFLFSVDQIKLVATDSFRLSEKTIPATHFSANIEDQFRALIPLKTAQELVRILDDAEEVTVCRDPNQILFQTEKTSVISRLVEGSFPDYTPIVPVKFETEIIADKQELLNAIRLAGIFSSRVSEVRVKIPENKKTIEVFSVEQAVGENNYILPAKIQGSAKEISFNWKYLGDGLKAIPGNEVFWGINEENKPALIKSPKDTSFFYVLMPILKA